ncbi:MAG: hypothetical protein ACYC9M_06190 [Desulfobulbaceae bacterium]
MLYNKATGNLGVGATPYSNVVLRSTGSSSHGIIGESTTGTGVWGASSDSYGVYGESLNSAAIYGYTPSGNHIAVAGQSVSGLGVYGISTNNTGVKGTSSSSFGISGETLSASSYSGYFSGGLGLMVIGNILATGTKNFIQEHPTNPDKVIVYTAIEAGEAGTYTRGSNTLTNGKVTIDLPEHFSMVTSTEGITVQVTPTGPCNGLYVASKSTSQIEVAELGNGTSNTSFDWIIYGVRKGYENYEVIRDNPMRENGPLGNLPKGRMPMEDTRPTLLSN